MTKRVKLSIGEQLRSDERGLALKSKLALLRAINAERKRPDVYHPMFSDSSAALEIEIVVPGEWDDERRYW